MADGQDPTALAAGGIRMEPGGAGAHHPRGWAALEALPDAEFFAGWLTLQCTTLASARSGVVLRPESVGLLPAAIWPERKHPPAELIAIAERAAAANAPVIAWARRPGGKGAFDLLVALGIRSGGSLAAVLAVAIDVPLGIKSTDPDAVAERLGLGAGWLGARLLRQRTEAAVARTERAAIAMDIVAVASAQRRLRRSATAVVNELAIRLRCDRVSLGLVRRGAIKLRALSHAASFQERNRIVDAIENAMEECLAQRAAVTYPPTPATAGRFSVAHRDLAGLDAVATVVASVVLPGPHGPVGVVTLERHGEAPFEADTLLLAEAAGALLGPVLTMQVAGDRVVSGRVVDWVHDTAATLLGRDKPSLKLAAIVLLGAALFLGFATAEYRVTARAALEGEVQRAAVTPFDGFVASSAVRPGDHVRAGDLLAAMDDHDLVVDRARAWADTERLRQKYNEAMAKHERSNVSMIAAEIEQAAAQLTLTEDKLQRSRIVSPMDGVVVSGDLTQMLGSPLERGKTLFVIAPLDLYRVVLRVDERDLRFLAVGQHGELALAGMPSTPRGFTVNRITPIAEAKDGRNEFRVEAALDGTSDPRLRPGMEGVAKVETGLHHLVWVWTHGVTEWLRLMAWKWLP